MVASGRKSLLGRIIRPLLFQIDVSDKFCYRTRLGERGTGSQVSSYPAAIARVFLTIMLLQIGLFTQNLAMKEPEAGNHINQQNPGRENQELAYQDEGKCHIDRITAVGEDPIGYQLVGVGGVDADPKALSERYKAPQQYCQTAEAERHSEPLDDPGMKKFPCT